MIKTRSLFPKANWPAKIIQKIFVGFVALGFSLSAFANPSLNNVAAGNVTVEQTATTTTVNQSSQQAILNWNSFNIGSGESTHFQQPAGGVALNRIDPTQGASSIYGSLTATGQIILVNPAGFYFGASSYVSVGSMIATTHNITDENFLNGVYQFDNVEGYNGAITNEGQLIAAQNGLIALVATGVRNDGMIQANTGKVVLASGEAFTMSFDGNGLVNFAIDQATSARAIDHNGNEVANGVTNTGQIYANGGSVLITAKAASQVLDYAINMEGVVEAQSVFEQEGTITLAAATAIEDDNIIRVAGTLDASGKEAGEVGGDVTITSKYILLDEGTRIGASGDAGGGNVRVGGNYLGQGPLPNATATVMAPDTSIVADAITNGDGGEVILWSDNATKAYGTISTRGGAEGGDGGFIETSGYNFLDVEGITIDTQAPQGKTGLWLLDPYDVIISTSSNFNGAFSGGDPNIWTPSDNSSNILVTTLESNLASTDVTINTSGAGAQTGNIDINSTIDWTAATTLTLNPTGEVLVQGGSRSINGTGVGSTLVINGDVAASPFGGSNSGSIWAHGGITITGNIDTGGTGIEIASNSNFTLGGVISGSGHLRHDGTGIMTLTNTSNSYTGGTFIDAGTIRLGASNVIPDTGTFSTGGNGLDLNNFNETIGGISGSGGINLGSGTLTFNGGGVFQGGIEGTGNLVVNTSGSTLNIWGNSTTPFSGTTTVQSGAILSLLPSRNTLNNTNITVQNGGTFELSGSGTATLQDIHIIGSGVGGTGALRHGDGNSSTLASNVVLDGNATIGQESDTINSFTINGVISGSFNLAVNANTSSTAPSLFNTITFGGSNTYTGTTTVSGGYLGITNANALGTTGSGTNIEGNAGLSIGNSVNLSAEPITMNSNTTGISYLHADFGETGTISSNINLSGDFAVISESNATLNINGTINGAHDVTLGHQGGASGNIVINGNIGNVTPPTSITTSVNSASYTFNTDNIITNGPQTYFGSSHNITTAGTTTFTANGVSSDIDISGLFNWTTTEIVNFTAGRNILINDPISGTNGTLQLDAANGSNTIRPSTSSLATIDVANFTILDGGWQQIDSLLNTFNVTNDFNIAGADQFLRVTGGDGGATPYEIADAFGLQGVATLVSSDFVLTADIDLTDTGVINVNAWNSGTGFAPIASYAADFDGAGFTITDLFQNIAGSAGMFSSTTNTASITGTGLVNANITGAATYIGGLVSNNQAGISLSYITGSVTNNTDGGATGGLIGNSSGATINDAYSQASVTGATTGVVGGFIGQTGSSETISRVYSTGAVTGGAEQGGLIGNNAFSSSTISNSFWDTQTSGQATSDGGTGQTTTQMQTQSTYTSAGWDFSTPVWRFTGPGTYPILNVFDPVTNLLFSGELTADSGTVYLLANGVSVGSYSINTDDVAYSIAIALGTISAGDNLLVYVDNGINNASSFITNLFTVASGANMSSLDLAYNALSINSSASTASNTALIAAKGAISDTDILYSGTGADLTLGGLTGQTVALTSTGSTTYTIDGLISTLNGVTSSINLAGPVVINGASVTTTGSQTYAGATTLSTTAALNAGAAAINLNGAVNGANTLTLTTTGDITIGSTIGNTTDPTSLTITSGANSLALNGASIDTSGAQTYNDAPITLGTNVALTSTAGDITSSGTIALGSNTLTLSNAGASSSLSGVISGSSGDLTKAGSGTLQISGINTYTGDTTINAGTLQLGASNVISNSSDLILADVAGVTFDMNGFTDSIASLSGGGSTGGNIIVGGTFGIRQSGDTTYSGSFSDTGTIQKLFSGNITFDGTHNFTGSYSVLGGSIRLGANNVMNDNAIVDTQLGGTFDLNEFSDTIEAIAAPTTSGFIDLGSTGTSVLTLNIGGIDSYTYNGVISGAGDIVKEGTGRINLLGANTYTGDTTVNAGRVVIDGDDGLGATSNILTLNGGTLLADATFTFNSGRNIVLGASDGTIEVSTGNTLTYGGVISGSGNDLNKNSSGTLILSGTNTYTGATNINAGTLQLGASDVIANGSAVVFANTAGAILDLNDNSDTIGSLSGGGVTGGNITLGAGTLTVTQGADQTYSGIISGTGALVKEGANTLTLAGTNTYTGNTTINAGAISISSDANLGVDGNINMDNGTLITNGTFTLDSDRTITLLNTGGIINVSSGTLSFGGIINEAFLFSGAPFTKSGAGTLILSGANSYTADTNITAGTLQLGASNVLSDNSNVAIALGAILDIGAFSDTVRQLSGDGTISLNGGTFITRFNGGSSTFAGSTTGNGTFRKDGTGTLILSGTIGHSGEMRINEGTVRLASSNIINDTLPVYVGNIGVFDLSTNNVSETTGVVWNSSSNSGASVLLGAASTLTIQSGSVVNDFYGVISGTGNIVKSGANPWDLRGVNTYTGSTTVNQGRLLVETDSINNSSVINVNAGTSLEISGNDTFGNTNNINLADTSTLILEASSAATVTTSNNIIATGDVLIRTNFNNTGVINGVISGNANIDYQASLGTGTITLGNTNTYTGSTTLDSDITLQLAAANVIPDASNVSMTAGTTLNLNNFNESIASLSGAGDITLGSGALTVTQGSDQIYSGIISGTGSLVKAGANTLTLAGSNTYTGSTTISAGTLQLATGGSLSDSTAVTANAIFDLNDISDTIGSLAGGGSVLLGSGTLTTGDANDTTFSGVISETGNLVKQGAGIFTLSAANTYTGASTISAGTLQLATGGSLSDSTAVTANAIFDLNDISDTIGSLAGSGSVLLGSGTLTTGDANDTTFSGVISETGNLVKQGAGIFTLSGANTYTGASTISAGTLQLATGGSLSDSTAVTANATFDLNNISDTIASLAGSGSVLLGSGTLTTGDANDTTFSGVISETGNLVKQGAGIFTLSGANTYTGASTISAGTLQLAAGGSLSDSTAVTANGTFDLNDISDTIGSLAGGGSVLLGSGTLTTGDANDTTFSGVISESGSLVKQGAGIFTLSAANTYTGTTTISTGTLQLSGAGRLSDSTAVTANGTFDLNGVSDTIASLSGSGSVLLDSGTLTSGDANDTSFSGVISESGSLVKQGAGIFTLSEANTYTGTTTLSEGTLNIANNSALGTSALSLSGGTLTANSNLTIANNFTLNANTSIGGSNDLVINGTGTLSTGILLVTNTGSTTLGGNLSGTGGITENTSGTLIISGSDNSSYSGTTTLTTGILEIGTTTNALGTGLFAFNGGTLRANNNNTVLTNGFTLGSSVIISGSNSIELSGNSTFTSSRTVNASNSADTTFSGILSGAGGRLVKSGTGNLILSGDNSFDAGVTMNGGSLTISHDNALGTDTLTYNSGSIIAGINDLTLANNININANLTFSGSNNATLSGVINDAAGSFGLSKEGTSNLTLSGDNTFDGDVTLNAGTLTVGHNNAIGTGTLTYNAGTLAAGAGLNIANDIDLNASIGLAGTNDFTLSGVIDGAFGVNKSNTSSIILAGANTFTGTTSITGGTLTITDAQGLGTTAGGTNINGGGTLNINAVDIGAEAITLNTGTINSTGAASLAGALTLAGTNNITAGGTFTLSGNINGAGNLTLGGAGDHVVSGNIGNSTAVSSLTTTTAATFGGTVTTANNQTYGGAVNLNAGSGNFTSNSGAIAFNSTLNGGQDVVIDSSGVTTLAGAVGGTTDLNSLNITASGISINGSTIDTVSDQTYNALVTLGAGTTLTTTDGTSATIALNNGIAGNQTLNLVGAATANESFIIAGNINATVTVDGGNGGGTNSLSVNTASTQNWAINAANGGTLSGANLSNTLNYNDINNLTGGSANDGFTLSGGGTLAGNIAGGAGTNTLTADNLTNTWGINGSNTGTLTGIGGTFSSIQNLVGGSGFANTFNFANGATISGSINGGTIPGTDTYRNTFNLTAYSSLVTVNLVGDIFTGNVKNSSGGNLIGSYGNINQLQGNIAYKNIISLPSGKTVANDVTLESVANAGLSTYNGFIGDPTWFSAFAFNEPTPTPDPGIQTNVVNNDVAQIIQQPQDNIIANQPISPIVTESVTAQSISEITQQADDLYQNELNDINIDPFCGFSG